MAARAWAFVVVVGVVGLGSSDARAHCVVPGTCHDAFNDCVDAPLGFWSDGEICHPCLPGQYADTTKSTQCKVCTPGSFSGSLAATSCMPCPAGMTAPQGASTCSACTPGMEATGDGGMACLATDSPQPHEGVFNRIALVGREPVQ